MTRSAFTLKIYEARWQNDFSDFSDFYDFSDFNLLKLIFILTFRLVNGSKKCFILIFRPRNGSKKWLLLEFLKKVSLLKIRKGECWLIFLMTMDYSPRSERENWPFLKVATVYIEWAPCLLMSFKQYGSACALYKKDNVSSLLSCFFFSCMSHI